MGSKGNSQPNPEERSRMIDKIVLSHKAITLKERHDDQFWEKFLNAVQRIAEEFKINEISTEEFLALYDRVAEKVIPPWKPSCKKGCSACCMTNIPLTELELDHIFKAHPIRKDERKRIFKNATRNGDKRFADRTPCIFLKDNLCSIYERRPIACRGYYVISDPHNCSIVGNKSQIIYETTLIIYENAWLTYNKSLGKTIDQLEFLLYKKGNKYD
jgi:Fe-S-cluster containining protein